MILRVIATWSILCSHVTWLYEWERCCASDGTGEYTWTKKVHGILALCQCILSVLCIYLYIYFNTNKDNIHSNTVILDRILTTREPLFKCYILMFYILMFYYQVLGTPETATAVQFYGKTSPVVIHVCMGGRGCEDCVWCRKSLQRCDSKLCIGHGSCWLSYQTAHIVWPQSTYSCLSVALVCLQLWWIVSYRSKHSLDFNAGFKGWVSLALSRRIIHIIGTQRMDVRTLQSLDHQRTGSGEST